MAGLVCVLAGCGPDARSQQDDATSKTAATTADLAALVSAGTAGRIDLTGDRYQVGDVEFAGADIELVGRGARRTVLEGPVRFRECLGCSLEGLTVAATGDAAHIIEVSGGSVALRDLRVGDASDASTVGIDAQGAEVSLENVWVQTGSIGLRGVEGGRLSIRHSIFEDMETAIEAPPGTELSLIDNLFAGIPGCVVRPTTTTPTSSLNAMFGNVRIPGPANASSRDECLGVETLGPRDADAAPVLLELRGSEALADSPALATSGPR